MPDTITRTADKTSAAQVTRSRALLVTAAILGLLLAAMDATVMGTVLPRVIRDVGGSAGGGYAWLVSGFLLAQVAATPIAGWVADRIGDRVISVTAVAVFGAASLLAASAGSFGVLVAARVLHGLAAGALVVSSYVIVGRLYGPQRRAAAQSLLSMVWGVAAVLGPVFGAAVATAWGWRWIFFLNVPLCVIVALILLIGLPPSSSAHPARSGQRGFPGTEYGLLIGGAAMVLLALQAASLGLGAAGGIPLGLAGLALIGSVRWAGGRLLLHAAMRATPSGIAAIVTAGSCMILYATLTVLPVQLAQRGTSTAGVAAVVGAAAIGWVIASGLTGAILSRRGYRIPMVLGGTALAAAAAWVALGLPSWPAAVVAGLGTGAVTAAALALIQDQAPPEQLGVATSSATVLRNLGAAVGINGIAAGAAVTSSSSRGSGDPVFWVLTAIALLLVLGPALFAPRRRTTAS